MQYDRILGSAAWRRLHAKRRQEEAAAWKRDVRRYLELPTVPRPPKTVLRKRNGSIKPCALVPFHHRPV
jgi:hypothetical protein